MSFLAKIFRKREKAQSANIVILGTSGAGKTTLVKYLESGQPVLNSPRTTLGIDIRQKPIKIDGWQLFAIDMGGQDLYRENLWSLGVSQANAVIYVIDSLIKPGGGTDDAFEMSKFAFDYMIEIVPPNIPILILMNKQDEKDKNPLSCSDAIKVYSIDKLIGRSFNILPTSAKYGTGVETAIEWLIEKIEEKLSIRR